MTIWPDSNWRDTQDDPCTCSPGDGTEECERFGECHEAFLRAQDAAVTSVLSRTDEDDQSPPVGPVGTGS